MKTRKRERAYIRNGARQATDRQEFKKQLKMEAVKMFYDMIQEFGEEFVGMWFMFSTMSVAGSVLIIACNIASKF